MAFCEFFPRVFLLSFDLNTIIYSEEVNNSSNKNDFVLPLYWYVHIHIDSRTTTTRKSLSVFFAWRCHSATFLRFFLSLSLVDTLLAADCYAELTSQLNGYYEVCASHQSNDSKCALIKYEEQNGFGCENNRMAMAERWREFACSRSDRTILCKFQLSDVPILRTRRRSKRVMSFEKFTFNYN